MLFDLSEDQINQIIEILSDERSVLLDTIAEVDGVQNVRDQSDSIHKLNVIIGVLDRAKASNAPIGNPITRQTTIVFDNGSEIHFDSGRKITMFDGTTQSIDSVKVGDVLFYPLSSNGPVRSVKTAIK